MTRRTLVNVVTALTLSATLVQGQSPEGGTRLKDVASLQGVNPTPVIGYGLVVGLNKTGDKRQTIFSTQTLANMLQADLFRATFEGANLTAADLRGANMFEAEFLNAETSSARRELTNLRRTKLA
jgi:hypothetical protein